MHKFFSSNLSRFFNRFENEDIPDGTPTVNIELTTLTPSNPQNSSNRNTFTTKSIDECKDISEVFQILEFAFIREELERFDDTLLLHIKIDQHFGKLSPNEQQQLAKKCKNKSIAILFASKNEDKFSVYWKSKELQHFLTFSPYNDTPVLVEKTFFVYFAEFLADCLTNGHLGIISSAGRASEKASNVELHLIADTRDFNLLLIAAESGRNDLIKILLDQKIDTEYLQQNTSIKVQDLAWEKQHYDVVLTLMKAGLTYPRSFDLNECSDGLKDFCEKSEELHAAVIAENEAKIIEILTDNQNPHPFYNRMNESAAKIALDMKQIEIYQILVHHKVFLGRNEILHDSWKNFTESERQILREIHFKNSIHMPEKHLTDLTSSSSVSHDDGNVMPNLNLVKYAFEILNQNPFIRIILMIVAASKRMKILFDFKSISVDVVDPTADSTTRGLFYSKGMICVAAVFLLNQSMENETFGTMAHELCHYAMNLVYRNSARPYRSKDRERRREFAKIASICEKNREKEKLIDLALNYRRSVRHAELIVRVPHLMALYHNQPEKLKEARENFSELFDFYEQKVVPDMKEALPRIEREIERMDEKILKNKLISIVTIIFSVIMIVGIFFVTRSVFSTPVYDFKSLSKFEQAKVENSPVNYKNVEVRFVELFPKNSQVYDKFTSEHISQMLNGQKLNFSDPYVHYLDELVVHSWKNLTSKLKQKILTSNLKFQNESLKFQNLSHVAPKAFGFLTSPQIISILEGKELKIEKIISSHAEFYIERNFFDELSFAVYYAFEKSMPREPDGYISAANEGLLKSEDEFRKFYEKFISQNDSILREEFAKIRNDSKFNDRRDLQMFDRSLRDFKTFHENFGEAVKKVQKTRLLILSSEAGTGKTTIFEEFTIRIKRKFPTRWVSYIDLKDFTRFYNKNESLGDVLGLLENILGLSTKNEFEMKIFEELFESGEVVLLWNGFDEISPKYSEFILSILKSIYKNSSNIQFLCTRPLYRAKLQDHFQIFPYKLVPFFKEKQQEFLRNFFISRKIDDKNIKNYTEKVFKIISKLALNLNNFQRSEDFNTPLLLQMIADLIPNNTEIYNSENLFEIYKLFIVKKIEIWRNRTDFAAQFVFEALTSHRHFDMMRMYQMYALKAEMMRVESFGPPITYSHIKLNILNYEVPPELTNEEISRMGILYINGKNEFKFSHKTFSEFFIAQFFIENVFDENIVNSDDTMAVLQTFFKAITMDQVENFFDSFLQTEKAKNSTKFNEKVAEIVRQKFSHVLFKDLNVDQLKFLLEFFKKDYELLVELLNVDENETFYTAMFNHAYDYIETTNTTVRKELIKKYLSDSDYKKFIRGKNQKGIILFSSYLHNVNNFWEEYPKLSWKVKRRSSKTIVHDFYNLDPDTLKNEDPIAVFKSITENLTEPELRELLTSKSSPVTWNVHTLFEFNEFWEIANKSLNKQDQKILFGNFLVAFTKSGIISGSERFPMFLSRVQNSLTDSEIREIFVSQKILHLAAALNNFGTFWNFFVQHSNRSERIEVLKLKISEGCFKILATIPTEKCYLNHPLNILQIALIHKSNAVRFMYQNYFNSQEIQDLIFEDSNDFLYLLISSNPDSYLERISTFIDTIFRGNEEKLRKILLRKIKPTNLNVFEYIRAFETKSEEKLKHLSKLLEVKDPDDFD